MPVVPRRGAAPSILRSGEERDQLSNPGFLGLADGLGQPEGLGILDRVGPAAVALAQRILLSSIFHLPAPTFHCG